MASKIPEVDGPLTAQADTPREADSRLFTEGFLLKGLSMCEGARAPETTSLITSAEASRVGPETLTLLHS